MKTLSLLGRFLYAIPLVVFGIFHFLHAKTMSGIIASWPVAEGLVYISGLALVLAGISIVINVKARLACLLLALFLLILIIGVHLSPALSGNQSAMTALLKDSMLLGAALTYSGILKK